MKQIVVIIRSNLYFKTKQALSDNRFFAMSTKEVFGRGKRAVQFESVEGLLVDNYVYNNTLIAKKMIEMVVRDEDVDEVVNIITSVNNSNANGDGKIFILPVEESVRIHTGEKNDDALM